MRQYNNSDIGIKMSKDELVEALTARIPLCVQRDQAWGRKQGDVTLEAFKRCSWGGPASPSYTEVQCPEALAPLARRLLGEVKLSNQTAYTISPDNQFWRIHELLTMDLTKPKTVC